MYGNLSQINAHHRTCVLFSLQQQTTLTFVFKQENLSKSVKSTPNNNVTSSTTKSDVTSSSEKNSTSTEFSDFSLKDPEVVSAIDDAQAAFEHSNFQVFNLTKKLLLA